ncbi:ATP synthase subunit s, mitochondrial isoform X8 [Zonotrichia albicollis]|uniref:ATP synthase subunit s, mitochondrial isoform X8 n=1 Tax=Zonotrichia albicollis TaxID=44394 RepID=UPI003D80FCB5
MAECRVQQVRIACWLLARGHSVSASPSKAVTLESKTWKETVKSRVDHERIRAVGPDRAASEWLLRCGARVRYQGSPKWQQDYNALPSGPLGKYRIEAISATDSCIMHRGFDYLVSGWDCGANRALCPQMAWSTSGTSSWRSACTSRTSVCSGSARPAACSGACSSCRSSPAATSPTRACWHCTGWRT